MVLHAKGRDQDRPLLSPDPQSDGFGRRTSGVLKSRRGNRPDAETWKKALADRHRPRFHAREIMSTSQLIEVEDDAARSQRGKVCDFIKKQVVHSLGTPCDLLTVQVRPVGSENYRVNVVVG